MARNSGFSSLEVLVSLSIAVPILVSIIIGLHASLASLKLVTELHQNSLSSARIASMLQGVLDDYDSHTFRMAPPIHFQGNITYTDNSMSPLMHSATHSPDPQSDAI